MSTRILLLASAATAALLSPALADEAAIEKRLDAMQRMIDAQQRQIESQKSEITSLKHALSRKGVKIAPETQTASAAPPAPAAASQTAQASVQDQIDALNARVETTETNAKLAR